MIRFFILVVIMLVSVSATAGEVKGAGGRTCGAWLEDRKQQHNFEMLSWMQGFISAYNQYMYTGKNPNGIFGSTDTEALAAWMDNYCRKNPLENVYSGTIELIEELKSKAQ